MTPSSTVQALLMAWEDCCLELNTVHFPHGQRSEDHGFKLSDFRDRSLIQYAKLVIFSNTVLPYSILLKFSSCNYFRNKLDKLKNVMYHR